MPNKRIERGCNQVYMKHLKSIADLGVRTCNQKSAKIFFKNRNRLIEKRKNGSFYEDLLWRKHHNVNVISI